MTRFAALPPASSGLRIGLLGGSFDPPHEGHVHISHQALKYLRLDYVWWLVTPENPLKKERPPASLNQRIKACRKIANHPRLRITAFETMCRTRYTVDTITMLQRRCARAHFIWLMGADNLIHFSRWHRWQEIVHKIPIAIFQRPGATHAPLKGRAAAFLSHYRVSEESLSSLLQSPLPAWGMIYGPTRDISSTRLRACAA